MPRNDFFRFDERHPCPICKGTTWCQLIRNEVVQCMREHTDAFKVTADKNGNPIYWHRLHDNDYRPRRRRSTQSCPPSGVTLAPVEVRHRVYSELLGRLAIRESSSRWQNLRDRGLSPEAIKQYGYGEFTEGIKPWDIAQQLNGLFTDLLGVPGFAHKKNKQGESYLTFCCPKGILIPVRNAQGQIEALMCRRDQQKSKYRFVSSWLDDWDGPKATPTIHVPKGMSLKEEFVRITEGPLKADVAWSLSGFPTVALPAANGVHLIIPFLKAHPHLQRVVIALDADFRENAHIARALVQLYGVIKHLGRTPEIEIWDADLAKGIDDALLSGVASDIVEAPEHLIHSLCTANDIQEATTQIEEATTQPEGSEPPPPVDNTPSSPPSPEPADDGDAYRKIDDPFLIARHFLLRHFRGDNGERLLRSYQEDWYVWDQYYWKRLPDSELEASLVAFTDQFFKDRTAQFVPQPDARGNIKTPTVPKTSKKLLGDTLQALHAEVIIYGSPPVPCWLNGTAPVSFTDSIIFPNGLLDLHKLVNNQLGFLHPPTPELFNTSALNFPFAPDAPEPKNWLKFLNEVFDNDQESISTLQMFFGYSLTADTRQHKMLTIIGPGRSGKSTIGHILTELVGRENTISPTLGSLAENFGLAPLVGKSLAVIGDAQLSKKDDKSKICETIKGIVGEDKQTINRKYREPIQTVLGCRFVMFANMVPELVDVSGTIASRMIFLRTQKSFLGKEDTTLRDRLMAELPGILCWAIFGWEELRRVGHFPQPSSGQILQRRMLQAASLVASFIQDRCEVGPNLCVRTDDLYDSWVDWCQTESEIDPGSKEALGRRLNKCQPHVTKERVRNGARRERVYQGIQLRVVDSEAPK